MDFPLTLFTSTIPIMTTVDGQRMKNLSILKGKRVKIRDICSKKKLILMEKPFVATCRIDQGSKKIFWKMYEGREEVKKKLNPLPFHYKTLLHLLSNQTLGQAMGGRRKKKLNSRNTKRMR